MVIRNEIIIAAPIGNVLEAFMYPEHTQKFYLGYEIHTDWEIGSDYVYTLNDDVMISGKIIESNSEYSFTMTFNPQWDEYVQTLPESIVCWEFEQIGENTLVKVSHEGLNKDNPIFEALYHNWVSIQSSLKTYIETGESIDF